MRRKRRSLPGELKAKLALAAVRGDKMVSEIAAKFEVHPTQVMIWKRQLLEGTAGLFADGRQRGDPEKKGLVARLYQQIGQLKVELDWLKKKLAISSKQRRMLIEASHSNLTVGQQCKLLGLPRSSFYYQPVPLDPYDDLLIRLLDEQYTRTPFYGVERMTCFLQSLGHTVGRDRVRRWLRGNGADGGLSEAEGIHSGHWPQGVPEGLRGCVGGRTGDWGLLRFLQPGTPSSVFGEPNTRGGVEQRLMEMTGLTLMGKARGQRTAVVHRLPPIAWITACCGYPQDLGQLSELPTFPQP